MGHPPPTHQIYSIFQQENTAVPKLQTELNYLDSFNTYCIFTDLGFPGSVGRGRW